VPAPRRLRDHPYSCSGRPASKRQAFRGTLGANVLIYCPATPEGKDVTDPTHDYLDRSVLPGRTFASLAHGNTQLVDGLAVVNTRPLPTLGCTPSDRIIAEPPRHAHRAAGGASDRPASLDAAGPRSLHPAGYHPAGSARSRRSRDTGPGDLAQLDGSVHP
jgi:hypothetical protein